jgi:hypothetical protein
MKPITSMDQYNYPSKGRCLYCFGGEGTKLTNEHIIPFALNGTIIALAAVCDQCQKLTHGFEQTAINADFYEPRIYLDFRRRKKKTEKLLPLAGPTGLVYGTGPEGFTVQLGRSNYPPILKFPIFERAGLLEGVERSGTLGSIRLGVVHVGNNNFQGSASTRTPMNFAASSLLLAKIAHSFAVSELGLDCYNSQGIRDLILGRRQDTMNFVGSNPKLTKKLTNRKLHGLYWREEGGYVSVLVHLFASLGVPPYEVVVGQKS